MRDKIYVTVFVDGGNVQSVTSTDPRVVVCVVDEDNIEAGDPRPDLSAEGSYDYTVDEPDEQPASTPDGAAG